MKILIVHNKYIHQGGEDEVVVSEQKMLEHFGHSVRKYERTNTELTEYNLFQRIKFFLCDVYWSEKSYREILAVLSEFKPDIVHVHNTFSMVGIAVYKACRHMKIPIVQTLHNYRFLCPIGVFYRRNQICEDCAVKGRKSAVDHRCWKNSYLLTHLLVNTINNAYEKIKFSDIVNQFIVPTKFSFEKHTHYGWKKDKLSIKTNFLATDLKPLHHRENYALFVGALQPYKGVEVLLQAFEKLGSNFPLRIIGDGPLKRLVESAQDKIKMEYLGQKPWHETIGYIQKAKFLILPSTCYEVSPRVIIEAFACGVPVIVSNIGGMAEAVESGKTGFQFAVNNPDDLAEKTRQLFINSDLNQQMGQNARLEYEGKYTVDANYAALMSIYHKVIKEFKPA